MYEAHIELLPKNMEKNMFEERVGLFLKEVVVCSRKPDPEQIWTIDVFL